MYVNGLMDVNSNLNMNNDCWKCNQISKEIYGSMSFELVPFVQKSMFLQNVQKLLGLTVFNFQNSFKISQSMSE